MWRPSGVAFAPSLFILFINDIADSLEHSTALLFADDLKLLSQVRSITDCRNLQEDLDKISEWCVTNGMRLNLDKCKVITFSRLSEPLIYEYKLENHPLERVDEITDLGVLFDSRMTFDSHITRIVRKACKMWAFINRNTRNFTNSESLRILYLSLVRPNILYASTVWKPIYKKDLSRLEGVQHRALRRLAGKYRKSIICHQLVRF